VSSTFPLSFAPDRILIKSHPWYLTQIYTHLSNALELSLLVAHSRKLDPPAPTPTLFQAFPPPSEPSRPSFDSDSDGGSDQLWGSSGGGKRRGGGGRWTKTWGGLIGALVGGVKSSSSAPKKGRLGLGLGVHEGKERPFSSLSTVMVDRPETGSTSTSTSSSRSTSTSTTGLSSITSSNSMTGGRDGSITPTNPATPIGGQAGMDKFTKACLQIQSTIFSTSPNVSFPPPPLLVRLRGSSHLPTRSDFDSFLLSPSY